VLQAGSESLPQGLVLPEGWSMVPLHRIGQPPLQAQGQQPQIPISFPLPPIARPASSRSGTPNHPAVPAQAMFSGQPPSWAVHPTQQQEAPPATNGVEAVQTVTRPQDASQAAQSSTAGAVPTSTSHDSTASAPITTNGEPAPTAPSSSLPAWGSAASIPVGPLSTTLHAAGLQPGDVSNHNEHSDQNGDAPTSTNGMEPEVNGSEDRHEREESSNSKSKQASVEELIEDPD